MLLKEAEWVAGFLAGQDQSTLMPVLNLGSSTLHFRERVQPFLDRLIFRPMRHRGIRIIHADLKADTGVDIAVDIMDDDGFEQLRRLEVKTILCCNILEHVPSALAIAERLTALLPSGGTLVVTVPNSFPYHPDPIDTLFRPSVDELAALFPQLSLRESRLVIGPTLGEELRERPREFVRRLIRSAIPLPRFGGWLSVMHHWRWLFAPYKVSCAIFEKS
ncbi:hypothetical protein [Arenibaculum sp.]|jgi:hypothetical protein|uniref:hypothetical protein n=1 Tax=Arenibaculum sp. TaxID=2865862 RepID=UPI002E13A99A|nr:hypothetical protein [Arenibaculum sp.]